MHLNGIQMKFKLHLNSIQIKFHGQRKNVLAFTTSNIVWCFSGDSVVKDPLANAGDMGLWPIRDHPGCWGETRPLRHNPEPLLQSPQGTTTESTGRHYWAHRAPLLSPHALGPVLPDNRCHCSSAALQSEALTPQLESRPHLSQLEKRPRSSEEQHSQK